MGNGAVLGTEHPSLGRAPEPRLYRRLQLPHSFNQRGKGPRGNGVRGRMARLTSKRAGSAWALGETPLTIGRRPDNAVVVNDPFASGRHAVIGSDQGSYYLEDLKSSNGTLLNGKPVQRGTLKHGDTIRIGNEELRFEDDAPELATQILSRPPVVAATPATTTNEPAPSAMLDELVGSIRSHRDREQQEREQTEARIRSEWEKMLTLADQLKLKMAGDARIKRFIVDRRAQDVMIQLLRAPGTPMQFITVSLRHPDQKSQALSGLWLRRTGEPDRCIATAQEVGAELVRDLAALLA